MILIHSRYIASPASYSQLLLSLLSSACATSVSIHWPPATLHCGCPSLCRLYCPGHCGLAIQVNTGYHIYITQWNLAKHYCLCMRVQSLCMFCIHKITPKIKKVSLSTHKKNYDDNCHNIHQVCCAYMYT